MISKKIVTPIIDKIIASGGTKKYVANLLEVDETNHIMLDELLEDKKPLIQLYIDMDMIENKLLDNIYNLFSRRGKKSTVG